MHALVVAHPNPQSRTDAVAMRVARGIKSSDAHHSVEMADLSAERFDPRFTEADVALSLGQGETPPEIAAEHARQCPGACLSGVLVVLPGAAQGVDRPRIQPGLGLRRPGWNTGDETPAPSNPYDRPGRIPTRDLCPTWRSCGHEDTDRARNFWLLRRPGGDL